MLPELGDLFQGLYLPVLFGVPSRPPPCKRIRSHRGRPGVGLETRMSASIASAESQIDGFWAAVRQPLTRVRLCATPWTEARQASLPISNSRSPPKPMSVESVMPSNRLILCRPLLLPPSIFPSIRVFSSKCFTPGGQRIGVSGSASVLAVNVCDCSVAQSCLTLCDLWAAAHRAPLSMGFSRQEHWTWLPCPPPPGDLPDPGIEPTSLALQAGFFSVRTTREAGLTGL